ncbi:MAG: LWR-salt protein [Haloferacaceae archaeon]
MDAAYVFRVRFRLDPQGVRVDPAAFETVLRKPAPDPGEDGWTFFRDALWRGEVADEAHLRERFADVLGVAVTDVTFSELEADQEYLDALDDAIEADLDAFNANGVREARHKYLGSSIRVV